MRKRVTRADRRWRAWIAERLDRPAPRGGYDPEANEGLLGDDDGSGVLS